MDEAESMIQNPMTLPSAARSAWYMTIQWVPVMSPSPVCPELIVSGQHIVNRHAAGSRVAQLPLRYVVYDVGFCVYRTGDEVERVRDHALPAGAPQPRIALRAHDVG